MGNVGIALKRFLSNKNTVTIIGVLLGIVILYIGYNWRVNRALELVSVPVAKRELASRTLIDSDMIAYIEIPRTVANRLSNLIINTSLVVGKYVSYGTSLPANSMFFQEAIMNREEMPDSAFADIPDNFTIYSLTVDIHSTYGNSIFPGNYIDLYFKGVDDTGKVVFGKLIESIAVLAVKDNFGNHVFETTVESRIPSELLFAVPDDMYLLLMKAKYIAGRSIEILPVPRNASYTAEPGETSVSSQYIRDFILSKTAMLPDNIVIPEQSENNNENDDVNENNQ